MSRIACPPSVDADLEMSHRSAQSRSIPMKNRAWIAPLLALLGASTAVVLTRKARSSKIKNDDNADRKRLET
jgi:hypothetical protein